MSLPPATPEPARPGRRRWPPWGTKVASLIMAGLVLGWGYAWAVPKSYQTGTTAGFWLGLAHGALMPAAFPCLLAGEDVPIFAADNPGRIYKIGFLCGINFCGLVFFGIGFRPTRPRERRAQTAE